MSATSTQASFSTSAANLVKGSDRHVKQYPHDLLAASIIQCRYKSCESNDRLCKRCGLASV